jgi:hypothetical protein
MQQTANQTIGNTAGTARGWKTTAAVAVLIGLLGGVRMLAGVAAVHGGRTGGDPYTYLQYSRNLAGGHFFLSTPVTDAVAELGRSPDRPTSGASWNTNILPNGRTAFTVAPGYPLVLAAAWRLGGAWLATHLNLALLAVVLALLAAAIAGGGAKSGAGAAVGVTAALLLPLADPGSFAQFSYAWREPLYVACILGAAWAVVAYVGGRDRRVLWVAAFLAGWACSVKEANVVYLPVLAGAVLASSAFRRCERKVVLTAQCAALFLLGVAPLLIQNAVTTGVPWVSLQSIRETRNYSLAETGAGLSAGNVATTLRLYAKLYFGAGLFTWPALLLAAAGCLWAQRRVVGRVMLGLFVLHVALYIQWRNADPRLMYFALIPYVAFLAEGVHAALSLAMAGARRIPRIGRVSAFLPVLPVLALALWPRPWLRLPASDRATAFSCRDALKLAAAVEKAVPADGVVLANRAVRDVIGALTPLDVVRFQDLVNFSDLDAARTLIQRQCGRTRVFWLDNVDHDPSHANLVDWRNIDAKQLSAEYDLVPAATFASADYHLGALLDAPVLKLLELRPPSNTVYRASLAVPPEGAAALRIDAPIAASELAVTLDGVAVDTSQVRGGFIPLAPVAVSSGATVAVFKRLDGGPLPSAFGASLVSWGEELGLALGSDARPDAGEWIVARDPRERTWGFRLAADGYRLSLPVRQRADVFTCAGLLLNAVVDPAHVRVVHESTGVVLAEGMTVNTIWFPLPGPTSGTNVFVGPTGIRIDGLPAGGARLLRAVLRQAWRHVPVRLPEGTRGVVVRGGAFADPPAKAGVASLRLLWGGRSFGVMPDPADARQVCVGVDAAGPFEGDIVVEGGGMVAPRCAVVGDTVVADPGSRATCDVLTGFYPPERDEYGPFVWSRGTSSAWVPLSAGLKAYRLRIVASSGQGKPCSLEVDLDGSGQTALPVKVGPVAGAHELEFTVADARNGLVQVRFKTEAWSPAAAAGSAADRRELGFRLYRLEWRPAERSVLNEREGDGQD